MEMPLKNDSLLFSSVSREGEKYKQKKGKTFSFRYAILSHTFFASRSTQLERRIETERTARRKKVISRLRGFQLDWNYKLPSIPCSNEFRQFAKS